MANVSEILPELDWLPCPESIRQRALKALATRDPGDFERRKVQHMSWVRLPFAPDVHLMHVIFADEDPDAEVYAAYRDGVPWRLAGNTEALRQFVALKLVELESEQNVRQYLETFLFFHRPPAGQLYLVDSQYDLAAPGYEDDAALRAAAATDGAAAKLLERLEAARGLSVGIAAELDARSGSYRVAASVAIDGCLFLLLFSISARGRILLLEAWPAASLEGLDVRRYPRLGTEPVTDQPLYLAVGDVSPVRTGAMPDVAWEPLEANAAEAVRLRLAEQHGILRNAVIGAHPRVARLPFYSRHVLVDLDLRGFAALNTAVFALDDGTRSVWLNGESAPIYETNALEQLRLEVSTAAEYVRFFCFFVRSEEGAFRLVESAAHVWPMGMEPPASVATALPLLPARDDASMLELAERLATIRSASKSLVATSVDGGTQLLVPAVMAYAGAAFSVVFAVRPDGPIEMVDDEPFAELDGLEAKDYVRLTPRALGLPATPPQEKQVPVVTVDAATMVQGAPPADGADGQEFLRQWKAGLPPSTIGPKSDREVNEAVVAVLLEEAWSARDDGHQLIRHFNAETQREQSLAMLAQLLHESGATLIIESDIPFVEEYVASILAGADERFRRRSFVRAVASADEVKCDIALTSADQALYAFSFHAYRGMTAAERTAHDLALRDAVILIGANRMGDVPEPLRRLRDLVLRLPRLDRRTFRRVFERVMSAPPPDGWDATMLDWTRYVLPSDFHQPRRLRWTPEQAVQFMRDRVERRLREVSPTSGPGLRELHGLGEAGQISNDLVADIRSATAGTLAWSSVDRGMLIAGPPGTGKTSLARAIAKECGIKFVVASASAWQSAGHLGDHLNAMRATFAEARRYAPSILFIDEIDSIGSRERMTAANYHGAQYQTEVVNCLLEQIQGFDVSEPVIVIAATNHPENVDPALRRAGRLDQVVRIPLPNIEGLTKILEYYLAPLAAEGQLGPDVKAADAAALMLGRTGADVEFVVRGALRRARKAGRVVSQDDLLGEVTRKPRRPEDAPQLGPEELRRVAVHEAGHATALLLGSRRGADLTYVSVVPRTDGTLGFVASRPSESSIATKREMLEMIDVCLAGRVAEELVYGPDDVGLGAGGPSERSDLAVATGIATMLVCQAGLGSDGGLVWTRTATPTQEGAIRRLLRERLGVVKRRLRASRALLNGISELLVERQEVTGDELREILQRARLGDSSRRRGARAARR